MILKVSSRDLSLYRRFTLLGIDPSIEYNLLYATPNNFFNTIFYDIGDRAFFQRPAAHAIVRAHQKLRENGYCLLIYDTYRPWFVTRVFWEATPHHLRHFVANPAVGSLHNRGCAADVTIMHLDTKEVIYMGGGFDEMTERSYPYYLAITSRERYMRDVLRSALESEGFTSYEFEWWHFDYKDNMHYPLCNHLLTEL